jgi:transposase-like protein
MAESKDAFSKSHLESCSIEFHVDGDSSRCPVAQMDLDPSKMKAHTICASKRHSYTAMEKLTIVNYALRYNQASAANKFAVHKSMVSRWMRNYWKIQNALPDIRRISSSPGLAPPLPCQRATQSEANASY